MVSYQEVIYRETGRSRLRGVRCVVWINVFFRLFERSPDSHPYKSKRNRGDAEFATSHAER